MKTQCLIKHNNQSPFSLTVRACNHCLAPALFTNNNKRFAYYGPPFVAFFHFPLTFPQFLVFGCKVMFKF